MLRITLIKFYVNSYFKQKYWSELSNKACTHSLLTIVNQYFSLALNWIRKLTETYHWNITFDLLDRQN